MRRGLPRVDRLDPLYLQVPIIAKGYGRGDTPRLNSHLQTLQPPCAASCGAAEGNLERGSGLRYKALPGPNTRPGNRAGHTALPAVGPTDALDPHQAVPRGWERGIAHIPDRPSRARVPTNSNPGFGLRLPQFRGAKMP